MSEQHNENKKNKKNDDDEVGKRPPHPNKKNAKNNNTTKKLSHALSWALRHQALNIGLTITSDGYVPVQEIMNSKHSKLKSCNPTLESIRDCVETSDKKRYKLEYRPRHLYYKENDGHAVSSKNSNDGYKLQEQETTILCIRANQGHSISIIDPNLLLTKLSSECLKKDFPCIVHGTYAEPWKLISQQGLKKMNRTHIHFAPGLQERGEVISGMRHSSTIHIFLDVEKCAKDDRVEFYLSDNGVILTAGIHNQGTLPPEFFSYVTDVTSGTVLLDNRINCEHDAATNLATNKE